MVGAVLAIVTTSAPAQGQEIEWPSPRWAQPEIPGSWPQEQRGEGPPRDFWAPEPPTPADPDPMVPVGIALTSIAGVSVITGTSMLAHRRRKETVSCGLSGCFSAPDATYRIGGLSFLTGGLALGLVGGGVWLGGATGEPRARRQDRWVSAGASLTGLGLSAVTAGVSALVAQSNSVQIEQPSHVEPWAGMLIGLGGAVAVVGMPLWGVGAKDWSPESAGHVPPGRVAREYSPAMKTAGIVLTSIGIGSFAGSGGAMAAALNADGFGGLGLAVLSTGLGLGGVVFSGIGIPLWSVGAHDAVVEDEARDVPVAPRVRLGPGNAELTWSF